MNVCSMCGKYHGSTVCPLAHSEPTTAVPQPALSVGNVSLNGMSFGEQQIIDKLDEIVTLLRRLLHESS